MRVKAAEGFLERQSNLVSTDSLEAGGSLKLDTKILYKDETFMTEWSNFKDDIHEKPRETLNCLGLAVHQVGENKLL